MISKTYKIKLKVIIFSKKNCIGSIHQSKFFTTNFVRFSPVTYLFTTLSPVTLSLIITTSNIIGKNKDENSNKSNPPLPAHHPANATSLKSATRIRDNAPSPRVCLSGGARARSRVWMGRSMRGAAPPRGRGTWRHLLRAGGGARGAGPRSPRAPSPLQRTYDVTWMGAAARALTSRAHMCPATCVSRSTRVATPTPRGVGSVDWSPGA